MNPLAPAPVTVRRAPLAGEPRYPVRSYTVEQSGPGGQVRRLTREACHRGDSAAVLLYHRSRHTLLLTRQLRLPPLLNGYPHARIVEVPGGLLDGDPPLVAACREVTEETGWHPRSLRRVLVSYLSPAVVTEQVHLFVAEYRDGDRAGAGGGVASEGEEIETLEVPVAEAYAMADRGEIIDGRTLLLLYYAAANGILPLPYPDGRHRSR